MIDNHEPGPTGRFPDGKISESDLGELRLTITADLTRKLVHIDFGTPTQWLAMPPDAARAFAALLVMHASNVGRAP